ncbi:unnamed protein product [Lactuca saligna]|uniref:Replication factor A C-terminal domain-containing protein n=1 Tax=Lactuca saligna TaxID=75948 RepID=A0AA35ZRS5_LACSI|nr:unnamed protein product [Lactuca saligna]
MNIGNKLYLKDIEVIADDSHLKLRVLKIWNFIKNNQVLAIEMIVMDEEGTKYQSRVFNQNFSKFRDLLKEGESYIILKPNMAAVKNGFSVTGHKQTLTLDWKSIVKKCDDFSDPVNGFVFADFNCIIEQKCPRDSFFDVIGQIVSFRPLETRNPNPSRHYIKMTISKLQSVHLNVTIFGSQAHQMSQYLKSNTTVTCVVIVMQFVKLNVWDGIGQAQSHFDVTKMFINSDIVEINEFKKELKADNNGGMSEKSITTLPSYSSSYIDDFKGEFPLKTVCEITEPLKEMKFLLVGTIVNIRQNLPWYYDACYKCGRRINNVPQTNLSYTAPGKMEDSVVVKCKNATCNGSNFHTVLKYIIPINVQDHTGTIRFTFFDREAKRLLEISVFELKKIHETAGDSLELFPNQMNVLKNRKFAFLVDITSYNVTNDNNIYTIVKLTEDVSIVSELESKLELMSVQSVSLNEVPLESDEVVQNVQKDVISQTDESFTPSTADKSTATSPMKISGDLKRNLHDVYDVDGGGDLSSTKSKRLSMGDGIPLLVPKVEK